MANQANEQLIRRLWELQNARKLDEADALYAPDWVGHSGTRTVDGAARRRGRENTWAAQPDWETTIDVIVSDGDFVVARTTSRGTHTGHLSSVTGLEVPPTGRRTEVTGMAMHRIANGKIAESWTELDRMTLMQQLGVVPDPRAQATRA